MIWLWLKRIGYLKLFFAHNAKKPIIKHNL